MQLLKKLVAAVLAAVIFIGFYQPSFVSADSSVTSFSDFYKFFKSNDLRSFHFSSSEISLADEMIKSKFPDFDERFFICFQSKSYSMYGTTHYIYLYSFKKDDYDSFDIHFPDSKSDYFSIFSNDKTIRLIYYVSSPWFTNVTDDGSSFDSLTLRSSSYSYKYFSSSGVSNTYSSSDDVGYYTNIPLTYSSFIKADKVLYGVRLNVDKDSFTDWLINNNKIKEIQSYWVGATVGNLNKIVEWWSNYNHSPALAFIHLPELFTYFVDVGYTIDDVADLYSLLKSFYFEYQTYLSTDQAEAISPSNIPNMHHRQDSPDLSLVTDHDDDTTLFKLLREILRSLIYLPKDISTFFNYLPVRLDTIISQLNSLIDFNNSFSDSLAAKIHSAFTSDIDDLIAAIGSSGGSVDVSNNISVDNFIDVTVPDQKQKEINEFFTDWNITFSDKINSKFPAAAQLGDIFNDQFFEKCGIDVNGDGEVFEYYSADAVLSPESSLSSPEGELLTQFVDQFDNSDSAYLDNVSFSEDVPDLTVSISGQKCSIFDFRIYAKYRTEIHGILTFILFITYFLSLYKSFPSILGRVSDVVHSFRTDKEV